MRNRHSELAFFAQDFRDKNGLNEIESIRIKSILHKNNILTIYRSLSSGFAGMCAIININTENKARFLLINSEHTIGKQHFTICHELYHLYFQKDFKHRICIDVGNFNKQTKDTDEYDADLFAVNLLLPERGVWNMIPETERKKNKIQISTVISIEQYYASSHSALLFRLFNMNLIDEKYKEELSYGVKNIAQRLGYNTDLYEKGNNNVRIGDYGTLAYKAWNKGIISESMYFSLLEDIGIDVSKLFE
ncbi:MAG: ImmA/IrrE family metallo-endopeptidase [Prevotellaceae bacterium]|jgi:Zn-dependent peptidase ImmA (M78 family)|nr:ImmA/IrrE family metallo-endopeptidase [Prevotellaceae bacterium]